MATTREIKRRITSVKNTQKITKAMEMVASVKLRKARLGILNARPYAEKLFELAQHLKNSAVVTLSPLLVPRLEVKKIALVVVGSDKGLCGGFNSNIVKKTNEFLRTHTQAPVELIILGKKPIDYFKRRNVVISERHADVFFKPAYADIAGIGENLLAKFLSGEVDEVHAVYNEFKNVAVQKTTSVQLLPVPDIEIGAKPAMVDYLFEPEPEQSLNVLLSKYFVFQTWRIALESYASEQGARMTAMSGATKNAGKLINALTLYYNKARQGAITKELLEIVGGAESLR